MSGFYYVKSAEETVECRARGRFRHEKSTPLVGDNVEFSSTEKGKGTVTKIHKRHNEFVRPPLANIDVMVIFASAAIPITDTYLIDKMIVIAERNDCEPIVCINKIDLNTADELFSTYVKAGFPTVRMSAITSDGLEGLIDLIRDKTCAFTGNSGVGKSSVLNAIDPDFNILTGDISKKLNRGRHTTRHVELYELQCGALVADTPGFSAFDTGHLAKKEDLGHLYRDFVPYLGKCRFLDCSHIKEPDCAIIDALNSGEIQRSRYDSYVRLYNQEKEYKAWENKEE